MKKIEKKSEKFFRIFLGEQIFLLTAAALVATSIILHRFPKYSSDDFKVLYTLFVFLVIVRGMERSGTFRNISQRISKGKFVPQKLILLSAVLSMMVTNDVALLVVVPLTMALNVENRDLMVIIETLVANSSSFLTPFGNPQNMFIYYHYKLTPIEFLKVTYPISLITSLVVFLLSFFVKSKTRENPLRYKIFKKSSYIYVMLFVLFTLAVFKILPLWIGLIPLIYALIFDKKSLNIDYFLIATFFAFFGLTDNLSSVFKISLSNSKNVFLLSALSSQVISNVPAALLFADFTKNWKSLLLGVNVGGFGTLFGSMANLISYKLYTKSKETKGFLIKFHIYSISFLALGITLYFLIYQ